MPIKVSLYGMDARSQKRMKFFLQGPCKNKVIVVKEHMAEVDLIDADLVSSSAALEQRIALYPLRPVIVLSLREIVLENVVCLKKPVQVEAMLEAIEQVSQAIQVQSDGQESTDQKITDFQNNKSRILPNKLKNWEEGEKRVVGFSELKKTNKHKTAMLLSETKYADFIGVSSDIDYNDSNQWPRASYQLDAYFLGIVQSAINKARQEDKALMLSFKKISMVLLPKSNEIWCDADNDSLKALTDKKLEQSPDQVYELTALALAESLYTGNDIAMDKFWDMDALLWKLACWTSKGRFPDFLDYDQPIFLKSWPNFTRLLNTPHALQISALLIERPRTLANIVRVLNIKAQYVFVFISAACTVGLAGQAERNVDVLVEPPEVRKNNSRNLLNQIVHKLAEN